jgi:voltage-gated potassium channel
VTDPPARTLAPTRRRRLIWLGVLRALATATVLVALYYLLPLDHMASVPLAVTLLAGLIILLAVATWQLRLILRARYPGVRAAQALAMTVPLFLLLFASAYYVMARASPGSFSSHLSRTDALYFTVTTFSTVGYGDITATSQTARLVVTVQMILDLLALGLGIRVFIGAVQIARRAQPDPTGPEASPQQPGQRPG